MTFTKMVGSRTSLKSLLIPTLALPRCVLRQIVKSLCFSVLIC